MAAYPVKGSEMMNKKVLWTQQIKSQGLAGYKNANLLKDSVKAMRKDLDELTKNIILYYYLRSHFL